MLNMMILELMDIKFWVVKTMKMLREQQVCNSKI